MQAKRLTPILNVSDIQQSFAWFEKLGWKKGFEWGSPATFGSVCNGECEIFLCHNAQGGRGRSAIKATFGPDGDETADKGVWMSVWVDDIDAVHERCLQQGLEVAYPPTDMPWNVREMHVRHPDGHVFRISLGLEDED
jgi:catechol 2,3-dioxygenase-like lactoylglutathione lyase family enzyme